MNVGPASDAHAERQREILPGNFPVEYASDLPGRRADRIVLGLRNECLDIDGPCREINPQHRRFQIRELEIEGQPHPFVQLEGGKLAIEFGPKLMQIAPFSRS